MNTNRLLLPSNSLIDRLDRLILGMSIRLGSPFHLLLEGRGSKAEGIALDPTTALLAFRSERKRP